jgi:hypothetical protein
MHLEPGYLFIVETILSQRIVLSGQNATVKQAFLVSSVNRVYSCCLGDRYCMYFITYFTRSNMHVVVQVYHLQCVSAASVDE